MDNLDVDGELAAVVVQDESADAATARLEGVGQTAPEVGLVNDRQALLDVTGLGHGGDVAISEVEDAVLLEDGAKHGLDDDAGGGVGDEGRLLMKLLGEEVDTEVAVLAGGGGGGDLDDLAGTALEHQEVAEADVVAGDGDGVGEVRAARGGTGGAAGGRGAVLTDLSDLVAVGAAILVVVTHLGLVLGGRNVRRFNGFFGDLNGLLVLLRAGALRAGVDGVFVDVGVRVVRVVGVSREGTLLDGDLFAVVDRLDALTVLAFDCINRVYQVLVMTGVDLNTSVVELLSLELGNRAEVLVVVVVVVVVGLLLDTGTGTVVVVMFFDTDLFFKALVFPGRKLFGSGSERRRVLTFPSGLLWLLRKLDLKLLMSFGDCLGLGLCLALLVGGGEDAEGDGDTSFKIQIGGLEGAERSFF